MASALTANPRRLKNYTLLASIVLSGLTLICWTGQWYLLRLSAAANGHSTLSITGDIAAPALIALALASLALVAALAIAGPFFRLILGILQMLIGFTVAFSAIRAEADPVRASSQAISTATGIGGEHSIAALVQSVSQGPWPILAIVVGVLTFALGIFVIVSGRRWPSASDRYRQPVRLEPADPGENAVADWDSLSGGSDPTSR